MNTNNIISTPDITGNIGSCTTQVARAISERYSWFTQEVTNIATNSCTGDVTIYTSWEFTAMPFIVLLILISSLLFTGLIRY